MEENVLQKICSKAKLDRDKGLQDLEELLKQFDREHVQNLEKHFSATLSDPNAEWETKHGALMGSKAICQTPFCSEEFSSYLIDQALLLADDSEFRVRIASGRCLPSDYSQNVPKSKRPLVKTSPNRSKRPPKLVKTSPW